LELIKGKKVKEISATGKIDIKVEYNNRINTITLPKNSTILKLR
jgi:flagellar basal body-associated protein FliL